MGIGKISQKHNAYSSADSDISFDSYLPYRRTSFSESGKWSKQKDDSGSDMLDHTRRNSGFKLLTSFEKSRFDNEQRKSAARISIMKDILDTMPDGAERGQSLCDKFPTGGRRRRSTRWASRRASGLLIPKELADIKAELESEMSCETSNTSILGEPNDHEHGRTSKMLSSEITIAIRDPQRLSERRVSVQRSHSIQSTGRRISITFTMPGAGNQPGHHAFNVIEAEISNGSSSESYQEGVLSFQQGEKTQEGPISNFEDILKQESTAECLSVDLISCFENNHGTIHE